MERNDWNGFEVAAYANSRSSAGCYNMARILSILIWVLVGWNFTFFAIIKP